MKFSDIFKDADGNVVIGQKPNWPIYAAAGLWVLRFIPLDGLQPVSLWGVRIVMLYWAYLEIVSGVNTFRRILGLLVALYFIYTTVRDLM